MKNFMYSDLKIEKIKRDMKELWKNTFHDSTRYIDLVFDTYYKPENAFTVYDGNKLIASLLGVKYYFQAYDERGEYRLLKGMYLCGLATHPSFRKRGIMTNLMKEAEISAKDRGYDLTFLIPADSHLRRYYEGKGYKTASFRHCQVLNNEKSSSKSKLHIYTFQEFLKSGNFGFIEDIAQWCIDLEKRATHGITLLHSKKDMITVIEENENSFFLTDSSFDSEYPILAKVKAVVFPRVSDEKNGRWEINGIYNVDSSGISYNDHFIAIPKEIIESLMSIHPDLSLEFNLPLCSEVRSEGEVSPYAMVKPLGNEKIPKNENPVFKISLMLD
ncbi:MAG: GNAT family N-acetyltransferase [Muribaculaceae bacterium]|nr:GNAT family N-acetyltransferase [Muribaculaceae bacterium]